MRAQVLEVRDLLSTTRFSAGGRTAYDLERHLTLPAPPETVFDLRRDNAPYFVKGFEDLFGGKPFQIFSREIVSSDRYGTFVSVSGEIIKRGWTPFRSHALLDSIRLNEDETAVSIKLKDTQRGLEEKNIMLDSMPKFAFLPRRFPKNIHMENINGLYLSTGAPISPFVYRTEYVYVLKDTK